MALTPKTRQQLKGKAHKLKPVVLIGHHGLTKPVKNEIEGALKVHELIKIRMPVMERDDKEAMVSEICTELEAERVQVIGRICILYKKRKD